VSELVSKAKALRAARAKLPLRGDKALQANLEMFCGSFADAYRIGADEAQREVARRIEALQAARPRRRS
jgi:hypothetical protein